MAAAMTAIDSGTKRLDQNERPGPVLVTVLSRGTAQARNAGYIAYDESNAIIDPTMPPNPSSRSGFACTNSRLAKPSEAHTIDQNDGGSVIRQAAAANESLWRRPWCASVSQLNVMYTRCDNAITNTMIPRFAVRTPTFLPASA